VQAAAGADVLRPEAVCVTVFLIAHPASPSLARRALQMQMFRGQKLPPITHLLGSMTKPKKPRHYPEDEREVKMPDELKELPENQRLAEVLIAEMNRICLVLLDMKNSMFWPCLAAAHAVLISVVGDEGAVRGSDAELVDPWQ
jgi:hypothetical protein